MEWKLYELVYIMPLLLRFKNLMITFLGERLHKLLYKITIEKFKQKWFLCISFV